VTSPLVMTARVASAHHDLITGNFVRAYGLPNPAPDAVSGSVAIQSAVLPSVDQSVTARRAHAAGARHSQSADPSVEPPSSIADRIPHDSRGPQGGVQFGASGGGAASPLMLIMAFALVAAPCVRFVPRPSAHLVCAEARRLERPG
jgi:hypothetical protein